MATWKDYTITPKYIFKSKIEEKMSDIFSDVITQNEEEAWTPQLRGSSLPICILQHAHSILDPHVRPKLAKLDQYSEFGTAAHNLFQKKFMQSKRWGKFLFGDYECPKCEKVYYKKCNRPNNYLTHKCKCGHVGLRYKELEGKYKNTIGVHVDTVLKFSNNRYWVIEYKTTGSFKIRDEKMKYKNKHHHQASSYPIVLEDVFNITPERYFIIYVNRDAPQQSKTSQRQHRVFPFKTNTSTITRRKEQLDKIVEAEKARVKYFKNPTLKNLRKLDDLRPCKSLEDYEEPLFGMQDKYESGESCPYIKKGVCGCFQTSKLSTAAKELHKKIKDKNNA